jgi:hypothetical protein
LNVARAATATLGASIMACSVAMLAGGLAAAGISLAVALDDRAAGTVLAQRDAGRLTVPLLPLAATLGWTLERRDNGWLLRGDGRRFFIRTGTRTVSEDGMTALTLAQAPVDHDRRLYVAVDDLALLFNVRAAVEGKTLAVATAVIPPSVDGDVAVTEHRKPHAVVAAQAPPTTVVAPTSTRAFQGTDRLAVTFAQSGGMRSVGVTVDTVGAIRSGLSFSDTGVPATGSVTLGGPNRSVTAGNVADPVAGHVFRDTGTIGATFRAGATNVTIGRRTRDGRTVTAIARDRGGRTDFVEILRAPGGRFDQAIAGTRMTQTTPLGNVTEELFAGTRGFGAGLYARTRGRLYGEATVSTAGAGLPLQAGDAPLLADGAYDLSRGVTARVGYTGGRGLRGSPFGGVVVHGSHLGGALTIARDYAGLSGSYAAAGGNAQIAYARTLGQTAWAMHATTAVRGAIVEFNADADSASTHELSLLVRRVGHGFDLLGGLQTAQGAGATRVAPAVGIAVPVIHGLDAEATVMPQGLARPAFRVSMVAGFTPPHRAPRVVTAPIVVRANDAAPRTIVVTVDGFRVKDGASSGVRVDLPVGSHYVRIATTDGAFASPDTAVDTATAREATLPLWPVRALFGRVVVDAPASSLPGDLTLAGVAVVLDPLGIVALADADGNFSFPPTAIAPDATIRIDPDTAPNDLAGPEPVAVGADTDLTVRLRLARRIERVSFPRTP